jgi:hypothetical protein
MTMVELAGSRTDPALDLDPWQEHAACLGKTWLAVKGNTPAAKSLCRSCPVLEPCRRWVMTDPVGPTIPGVVAGLSIEQRAGVECACGVTAPRTQTRNGKCWSCYEEGRKP